MKNSFSTWHFVILEKDLSNKNNQRTENKFVLRYYIIMCNSQSLNLLINHLISRRTLSNLIEEESVDLRCLNQTKLSDKRQFSYHRVTQLYMHCRCLLIGLHR